MPGSPFYSGLFEGFQNKRAAEYEANQKADAASRATEGKIYEYLLQSQDPEIQSLALSGLFESARPGTRAKGLKGFLGEVQGGEIYPQLRAAMEEQVPDAAAPPARPGSAALPSTTPVHGGGMSGASPAPGGLPGQPLPPEPAPPGAGPVGSPVAQSGPAPAAPAGLPAPPPPEHPTHRRGTGIPTAEEVAESTARAAIHARISEVTAALTGVGGTPEMQQRAIMGIAGAPLPLDRGAAGPIMADPNEPNVPIPTLRIGGQVVRADTQEPVTGLIGYVKPTTAGGVTSTVRDTPAIRQQYGIAPDAPNPSGFWRIRQNPDGTHLVMASEYTPAPDYTGTATLADAGSPTGRSVVQVNRGGGAGPTVGPGPAPEGQATPDQAEAEGWVKAVDKAVTEGRFPGLPLSRGSYDTATKNISQGKYQSYADLQKAAQKSGSVGLQTPGGSMADRVRDRINQNRAGRLGTTAPAAPPAAAPAPARARGAGPVGR